MKKPLIILCLCMAFFGFKNANETKPEVSNTGINANTLEKIYFIEQKVVKKVNLSKYKTQYLKKAQPLKELMTLLEDSKVELIAIKDSKDKIIGAFTAKEFVYLTTSYEVTGYKINRRKVEKIKKLCDKICNIIPPPDCNGTIVGLPSTYGGCSCMCIPSVDDLFGKTVGDLLGPGLTP